MTRCAVILVTLILGLAPTWARAEQTPSHARFGLPELKNAIEQSGASEIEDVLPILERKFGSNFTVVYDSDSAQDSTLQNPRIVMWDEYAGLVATFNGHVSEAESNVMEMIQFDFNSAQFNFLRQTFPLARSSQGTPQFAPTAPKDCKLCHGTDPRPIWAEYPKWPGVLGGDNDFVDASRPEDEHRYIEFVREASSHPRYRELFDKAPKLDWPTYPYRSETGPQEAVKNSATLRPNLRLTELLARLNALRVMRLIRKNPDYAKNIPALLYGFLGCDGNGIQKTPEALLKLAGVGILDIDLRTSFITDQAQTLASGESYFDGSGSMNELLANEIFKDAVALDPSYQDVYVPNKLRIKYRFKNQANTMDTEFNTRMDELGQWIPIPYPAEEMESKHRQQFTGLFREFWKNSCDFVEKKAAADALTAIKSSAASSPAKLTAEIPARPKDPLSLYQNHCAQCHEGANAVDLSIHSVSDMKNYRDMFGQSLAEKIRLGIMPKGLQSLSPAARAEWERDKSWFLKDLE